MIGVLYLNNDAADFKRQEYFNILVSVGPALACGYLMA